MLPRAALLAAFVIMLRCWVHYLHDSQRLGDLLQGGLDHRVSGAIITASECTALLAAFVIVLSMLGVNVNALLLPAGIALAYAAKDLSHNFLAGRHGHLVLIGPVAESPTLVSRRGQCCWRH